MYGKGIMRNLNFKTSLFILIISLAGTGLVFAQQDQAPTTPVAAVAPATAPADAISINQVIDRIIGREFLGEVRTFVFDVTPKKGSLGTFKGRIWAEDKDYNVVRFNGTYGPSTATKMYFHFDSWREFMGNGEWLPAYVYTEESDMGYLVGSRHLRFKGQTRLWGYNAGKT